MLETTRNQQRLLETTRNCQRLVETIRDQQRLAETIRDYQRLLKTIRDYQRLLEAIRDYLEIKDFLHVEGSKTFTENSKFSNLVQKTLHGLVSRTSAAHAQKLFYATQGILFAQKLSNKQGAKAICRLDRLILACRENKKPYE